MAAQILLTQTGTLSLNSTNQTKCVSAHVPMTHNFMGCSGFAQA